MWFEYNNLRSQSFLLEQAVSENTKSVLFVFIDYFLSIG